MCVLGLSGPKGSLASRPEGLSLCSSAVFIAARGQGGEAKVNVNFERNSVSFKRATIELILWRV
jgi:hypothetical protein